MNEFSFIKSYIVKEISWTNGPDRKNLCLENRLFQRDPECCSRILTMVPDVLNANKILGGGGGRGTPPVKNGEGPVYRKVFFKGPVLDFKSKKLHPNLGTKYFIYNNF